MNVSQAVTPAGASTAVFPIPMLPGAGGLEPKLSLSYSSQAGNSGFGLGWSLVGFQTIVRGAKTREVDGAPGPIRFATDDAFYLDNERLVPTGHLNADDATRPAWLAIPNGAIVYRRFIDDGTLAYARLSASGGILDFITESKSGLRTTFGIPVVGAPALAAPAAYLPSRTADSAGNYIVWTFRQDGLAYWLTGVDYTGLDGSKQIAPFAHVELTYKAAPKAVVIHLLGQALTRSERLDTIVTTLNGQPAPAAKGLSVSLVYRETEKADAYYLIGADLKAFADSLAPTTFDYVNLDNTWKQVANLDLPALGGAVPTELTYKIGTATDAAGVKTKALFLSRVSNGQLLAKTYLLSSTKWLEAPGTQAPPIPFTDNHGNSTYTVALDLDGDGLTDLVQSSPAGLGTAWRQLHDTANPGGDRWVQDQAHNNPGEGFFEADGTARANQMIDLGHGRKDIVVREATGRHVVLLNQVNGWVRDDAHFAFTVDPGTPVVFGDFGCDGTDGRVQVTQSGTDLILEVFTGGAGGWIQKTAPSWSWKTSAQNAVNLRAIKIDKAPCQSLLVSVRPPGGVESLIVLQGSSAGWSPIQVVAPGSVFSSPTGSPLHPVLVDLNGDGLDDIILDEVDSTGLATNVAWVQSGRTGFADAVTWIPAPLLKSPVQLAGPGGLFTDTFVQGWHYNGQTAAIVTIPSTRNARGVVRVTSGTDWQQASDLAPAQPLAQTKQSGEFYRFVDLDNDGRQDLIFNDGTTAGAELNTLGGWVSAPQWAPPRALAKSGDLASRATLIDVDGDGFVDLVYAYKAADETVTEVRLNDKGRGWLPASSIWKPPAPMVDTQRGDLGWRFADINGDGRVDLVQGRIDKDFKLSSTAYVGTAVGWVLQAPYAPTVAFVFDQGDGRTMDLGTQLVATDGGRLPDLVAAYRDPLHKDNGVIRSGVFRNTGVGFATTAGGRVPVMLDAPYFDSATVSLIDVDGDGFPDLVRFTADKAEVWLANGYDWDMSPAPNWALPASARSDKLGFGATRFVDMNGDGRLDILYIRPTERGVIVNTGSGWQESPTSVSAIPPTMPAFLTDAGDDAGVRLVDVTGHGALDVIQSAKSTTPGQSTVRSTWQNPGQRQGMLNSVVESNGAKTTYAYVRLVDYQYGQPVFKRSPNPPSYPVISMTPASPVVGQSVTEDTPGRNIVRTYAYSDFQFDLVNSQALGFGAIDRVEKASDESFTIIHSTSFRQDGQLAGHPAVEDVRIDHGVGPVTVEHTTKDWKLKVLPGAALPGGGTFTIVQPVLNSSTTENYDLTGKVLTGKLITDLVYDDWLNGILTTVTKPGRARQTISNHYVDPAGGTAYARYGRVSDSTAQVTELVTGTLASTRRGAFTYDPVTYLVSSESIDFGDSELNYSKTYGRDDRGNLVSTSQQATSGLRNARFDPNSLPGAPFAGPIRSTQVDYDPQILRLPIARINAKQQRTDVRYLPGSVDMTLGLSSGETDPNSITTMKSADSLGRPASLTGPDGVLRTVQRELPDQAPPEWLAGLASFISAGPTSNTGVPSAKSTKPAITGPTFAQVYYLEIHRIISSQGISRLEQAVFFDRSEHIVRTITPRTEIGRSRLAFKDFQFDVRGHTTGETAPYFVGDRVQWTTYTYDELGRRTSQSRPDGGTSNVIYSGLTQTRVNARMKKVVGTYNLDGMPIKIVRADGGIVVLEYDAMERLKAETSPSGSRIEFSYDGEGNRTLVKDPNAGTLQYRYDGFGQLREEKAGSQQWAELDYDELGRPSRAAREDEVIDWTYDKAGGIGRPDTISMARQNTSDALSYTDSFDYDAALRVRRTTTSIQAAGTLDTALPTTFRAAYTYGYSAFGQLARAEYPKSGIQPAMVVERQYDDATGQLVRILDARTDAKPMLWRLTAGDAAGRVRGVSLGNGAREVRNYSPKSGRLSEIQVLASTGNSLLASTFDYDLDGNMVHRGTPSKIEETFGYDDQDRLTNFARQGAAPINVTYDQDDRIRSKTGVGMYHYATDKDAGTWCQRRDLPADALCGTERQHAIVDLFDYDEFGSVTSRKDATQNDHGIQVEYTSDHHVARITKLGDGGFTENRSAAEFYYGPTGQRVLSRELNLEGAGCAEHRSKETVHLGLYERITVKHGCSNGSRLVTDRAYVQADEGVFLAVDSIDRSNAFGAEATGRLSTEIYQHRDGLGSVVMITRDDGKVGANVRYDPWGNAAGDFDPHLDHNSALNIEAAWTNGFTGQDHIAEFDVIHMTGRVYDPELGIFLSVDPLASDPGTGSDLNPYLYAHGNPLAVVDPTGFWGWGDVVHAFTGVANGIGHALGQAGDWVGQQINKAEQWVGQNWREIVTVVVIIAVTAVTAGAAGPVLVAMAAGAAGAMTETALYGGSVQDVLAAGVMGAAVGAISGGIGASGSSWYTKALLQGVVSGALSTANGKSFEQGFVIGALSRVPIGDAADQSGWGVAERVAVKAAVNGGISAMQGDKFEDGVEMGVLIQSWNECSSCQDFVDQKSSYVRSYFQSFSWFASGPSTPFEAKDLITFYNEVSDMHKDRGVSYNSRQGNNNPMQLHANELYRRWSGQTMNDAEPVSDSTFVALNDNWCDLPGLETIRSNRGQGVPWESSAGRTVKGLRRKRTRLSLAA